MTQLLRKEGVKYDAARFQWIGNMAEINGSLAVWHTVPIEKLLDARQKEIVIGATGTGSETFIDPAVMNAVLGTRFKLVMGYRGVADLDLALEKGEIQGRGGAWLSWKTLKSDWLEQKKVRVLVQVGLKRSPDLPDIPLLTDFARNDDDRKMLEFVSSRASIGRSLVAPPGVPADRVAALRKAFDETMKDPAFLASAKKRHVDIQPSSWQEVDAVVRKTLATPKHLVEKTSKILGLK
jgi:tripartite-type tricarboxylate transporter receptor subunit TctC